MYFLSFETSTKIFSIALNKDEKVLRFRNIKSAFLLENAILPAMDKILDSAGLTFGQIDGFAIALGPGSFTSLRVGLATVKAFCLSTGKPVVGVPTLDIIAHSPKRGHINVSPFPGEVAYDEICVINDARRDKVYACLYDSQARRKSDYLLAPLEEILDRVKGKTLFVGDALGLYRQKIEAAYQRCSKKNNTCKCLFADEKWWYPQAKVMAPLAYERLRHEKYDDASKLLPIYLYAQDCQVTRPQAGSSPNALRRINRHSQLIVGDPKKNN